MNLRFQLGRAPAGSGCRAPSPGGAKVSALRASIPHAFGRGGLRAPLTRPASVRSCLLQRLYQTGVLEVQ